MVLSQAIPVRRHADVAAMVLMVECDTSRARQSEKRMLLQLFCLAELGREYMYLDARWSSDRVNAERAALHAAIVETCSNNLL